MTFDSLIHVKMAETEIFDRFAEIVRQNFYKYRGVFIMLELGEADGHISYVTNIRFYKIGCAKDTAARREFLFGGEYHKAFLMANFENGYYYTAIHSHFTAKCCRVYASGLEDVRIMRESKPSPENDRVNRKVNHELIKIASQAFAEIADELKKAS